MSLTDLPNFEQLVYQMRCRQKEYFQRPIAPRLIAAKTAERAVDNELDKQLNQQQLEMPYQIPAEEVPY